MYIIYDCDVLCFCIIIISIVDSMYMYVDVFIIISPLIYIIYTAGIV